MILASIPRCGSTYLYRSIAGLPQGGSTPSGDHGGITKTHRPPPAEFHGPAIFLFGDIATAVLSTYRYRMDPQHFANCGAEWQENAPLFDADILHYGDLWRTWRKAPGPVLFVRYRALPRPEVRRLVGAWLERDIRWLPWRERRTVVEPALRRRIRQAYAELVYATEKEPDLFVGGCA